jgi:putative CocE/NonD family hydrolase
MFGGIIASPHFYTDGNLPCREDAVKAVGSQVLLLLFFTLAPVLCSAREHYPITFERDVEASMRDGIVLLADVYRPDIEGKFPVLLLRTPYDKQDERDTGILFAQRGYVVILQDVRGRYASPGEWYPFKHEAADGYDTVEWAAALPYANGKVGMFGGSYEGATQMLAAIAHPPHLAGIFPVVTASNYHNGWVYEGGAFQQWMSESWTASLSRDAMTRRVRENTNALTLVDKLPLSSYPVLNPISQERLAPYFFDWLAHPSYDDFWKEFSVEEHFAEIAVPAFHTGAWYDIFLGGTLRNYLGLKAGANGDTARRGQRLVIGIGGHAGSGPKIGELDFGPKAELSETETMLRWYDFLLKNVPNGIEQEKPVRIFVMGINQWREEDEWPLARAESTPFFLQSDGHANSLLGDGHLTLQPVKLQSGNDKIVYDPANPVTTHGGPICCTRSLLPAGPLDQRSVEGRDDVLVYTTPAFENDFEVTGPIWLDLYVSTSAVDTDFTAKLVDVWPNGFAQNLSEGIQRLRYRNSRANPELANPGEIYRLKVELNATSNVFLAGHKLRLEVSSSNFPRFDRNLNTGEPQARATRMIKAENTVLHDKAHPSALILPVVPR